MTREGTPFPYEGPVEPELLIDREDELAELGRRAGDRVSVRLAAPRRFGKTSVLIAHARALRQAGWRTVHVDLSRVADLTDVARRVARAYGHLDASWVRDHLSALLSRLGVSLGASGPSISLGPRPWQGDPAAAETVLMELLDLPKSLYERDGTPTLVVFDEFQDLLVARKDLDGLLRSQIQYHGDAASYVYAGSEPSLLRELFEQRERPLFGQARALDLGPLPAEAVVFELSARYTDERLSPQGALGELVAFAAGHPQRTMLLAHLLAEALADGARANPALAAQVIDSAVQMTAVAHQAVWQAADRTERAVLAAVADGVAPTSRALAAQHNVARTTLGVAAGRLADHGHLVRDRTGSKLVDPLLAEWLRRR